MSHLQAVISATNGVFGDFLARSGNGLATPLGFRRRDGRPLPPTRTALAAEHMAPGSSVINISSKASLRPSPFTIVYAAAKQGGQYMHNYYIPPQPSSTPWWPWAQKNSRPNLRPPT